MHRMHPPQSNQVLGPGAGAVLQKDTAGLGMAIMCCRVQWCASALEEGEEGGGRFVVGPPRVWVWGAALNPPFTLSWLLGLALPTAKRHSMTSTWLLCAALCSAVQPFCAERHDPE